MKTPTIRLAYYVPAIRDESVTDFRSPAATPPAWRVMSVTDSIQYHPGQILRRNEVDALCASSWKVTIVGDGT